MSSCIFTCKIKVFRITFSFSNLFHVIVPPAFRIVYILWCLWENCWLHWMVMVSGIMFRIIIGDIYHPWIPKYMELRLAGSIMYPLNYHSNWKRFFFQYHINNTCWHRIVFHNWYGELWMVYLPMEYYDIGSKLKVIEYLPYLHHYSWH